MKGGTTGDGTGWTNRRVVPSPRLRCGHRNRPRDRVQTEYRQSRSGAKDGDKEAKEKQRRSEGEQSRSQLKITIRSAHVESGQARIL